MSLVFKLYRLQQVDGNHDRAEARLRAIELALSEDQELRAARAAYEQASDALAGAQTALRRAEENTQAQRQKIEQSENALYGGKVTNPKELEDLQNEVAALKRYLVVLEDRQLEAMLALDDARSDYQAARENLDRVQTEMEQTAGDLIKEQETLRKEVARLEAERAATIGSIPQEPLQFYEDLRRQRQGLAVARVNDSTCSACGSTISSALLVEARSPDKITRCDFCGRILYAS